jgi:hypothetical protein
VWIVTHLSPFIPRSCMSRICYIRGAGENKHWTDAVPDPFGGRGAKKAKFCGAIAVPDPFGGRGPKKSKVLWRDTNPARFFPVKHTYLSLDTYATEKRSNVPRPSRHGLAPNLSTVRKQAALTARRLGTTQTSAMRGRFSRRPDFVKVRMITEAKR